MGAIDRGGGEAIVLGGQLSGGYCPGQLSGGAIVLDPG